MMPPMELLLDKVARTVVLTHGLMAIALVVFFAFAGLLIREWWSRPPRERLAVGLVVMLGLVARVVWALQTQPLPHSDFAVYWQFAQSFAQGDYRFEEISRHPGLSLWLSWFLRLFGPSLETVWFFNGLISLVMMLLFYVLGKHLGGRVAGGLALFLGAFHPQMVAYTALVATEIPAITVLLLAIWAVIRTRENPSGLIYWLGLGFLIYGAVLIRSSHLILLGLIPVLFVLYRRAFWQAGLRITLLLWVTVGILLSAWIGHQYVIGGSPKLFWGSELWLSCAIQYDRDGRYTDPVDMAFYPKVKPHFEAFGRTGQVQHMIRAYEVIGEESMAVIRQDPVKYLLFGFTRMRYILGTSQSGVTWSFQQSRILPHEAMPRWLKVIRNVSTISWQVLLWISPLGLLALRPRQQNERQELMFLLVSYGLIWLVFHFLVAVASERYAMQFLPVVFLMDAAAVAQLLGWLMPARQPAVSRRIGLAR
ncbi:MAG: ArnT family glycosyltransferase [Candidatus Melainabacteria bacterium]